MSELPPFTTVSVKGTDTTPSLLYNNLTSLDEWVAYVHKSDAVVVNISSHESPVVSHPLANCEERTRSGGVYQVKAVDIMGVPTLIAATQGGVILWDLVKEKVLASYAAENAKDIFMSRGIAVVEQRGSTLILVGNSDGSISALDYSNGNLSLAKTLSKHHDSITDINAGNIDGVGYVIASADNAGEMIVWSEDLEVIGNVSLAGDTVTSIHIFSSFIAASCGSGVIKLYNAKGCTEAIEIAAHARWINATAFHPEKQLLASVSEDMLLCVWKMPCKETGGKVRLEKHALMKDCLLTGVRFVGSSLVVSAYDWDRVFYFADAV